VQSEALHRLRSESQRSRSPLCYRSVQKKPTRNTVAEKQAVQEDLDSGYLFSNRLQRRFIAEPFLAPWCFRFAIQRRRGQNPNNSRRGVVQGITFCIDAERGGIHFPWAHRTFDQRRSPFAPR
jgi:hypothetical protein